MAKMNYKYYSSQIFFRSSPPLAQG